MCRSILGAFIGILVFGQGCSYSPATVDSSVGIKNSLIVYRYPEAADATQIYTILPDASNRRQLTLTTVGGNRHLSWSYDGMKIAFTSTRTGSRDIWVMDADGSNGRRLTDQAPGGDCDEPAWSPAGKQIAFSTFTLRDPQPQIWVMDADGKNQKSLITNIGFAPARVSWRPAR
jgi:Tol biopolymer transport system component